jgi:hypothetical protein
MDEEVLHGGVANAGAVTRLGDQVFRPSNPHTPTIHRFLTYVRSVGFDGASEPIGVDADGRERLRFIAGDVPTPPYPEWAQHDDAISSAAELLRGLHDASAGFDRSDTTWSPELADVMSVAPDDAVICHNDVCLENVVFTDGRATGLLDFDFAAPGRRSFDVAALARMCVPIDDPTNSARNGWGDIDRVRRLRLVVDAYRLGAAGRAEVIECLDTTIGSGGQFVRRRVEAGDANFIAMWDAMGGAERFERRHAWWAEQRDAFASALAKNDRI